MSVLGHAPSCCSWQGSRSPARMTALGWGQLNIQPCPNAMPHRAGIMHRGSVSHHQGWSGATCPFCPPPRAGGVWLGGTDPKKLSMVHPNSAPTCPCSRVGVTACRSCTYLLGRAGQRSGRGHDKRGALVRMGSCIIDTEGNWGAAVPGEATPNPNGQQGAPYVECVGCSAPTSRAVVGAGCRLTSGGLWRHVGLSLPAPPCRCGTASQGRSWC